MRGPAICTDVGEDLVGVDPSLVVGEPDHPHDEAGVVCRLHDPARRDARDLVLGRRAAVNDRRTLPDLASTEARHPRQGNACDSPHLSSHPGSAGSWSVPMSSSTGRASIPERRCRASSTSQLWPSATGTTFIAAALEAGATAYLTMREPVGGTCIVVADTALALMNLGMVARDRVGGVIGITGSVGKTTTKDLLSHCLAAYLRDGGERALLQQRTGPPPHAAQCLRRSAVGRARDGSPWCRPHPASRRGGPAQRRHRDQRRHGPRGVLRRPGWRGAPRRASS